MSFTPFNTDHQRELESDNEAIIRRLDAIILLLEILTGNENTLQDTDEVA